jgi:D-alanyl-D-alanine endopeptidase (penicillin-binding protein 7)
MTNLEAVRRATILLFPLGLTLALVNAEPSAGATVKAPARKAGKTRRPARKGHVFLEKHVVAVKNNLPNVQALGSLVIDLDSGQELFNRKADQPRAIASISKLAAALVIADRGLELDGLTTMKKVDVEVAKGGAPSRLPEGMTLSNRDLLHAALLGSDNRAVSALGRAVGLTAPQFAEAMNKKVAQLGLKHTHFREPTGLSPENVSTPREVIAMLRAAMATPLLGPVLRRVEYDAHPVARGPIRYVNTHRPAHRGNTDVMGGKTGFNDQARYCLVLAARVDGHSYGMAFLGTEGKMTRFGDSARVADWLVVHKPKAIATAPTTALAKASAPPPPPSAAEPPPSSNNAASASAKPDGGVASGLVIPPAIVARPY